MPPKVFLRVTANYPNYLKRVKQSDIGINHIVGGTDEFAGRWVGRGGVTCTWRTFRGTGEEMKGRSGLTSAEIYICTNSTYCVF